MGKVFILWDIDGTLNVHGRISLWNGEWLSDTVSRTEAPHLFAGLDEKHQEFELRVNASLLDEITALGNCSGVVNAWFSAWSQAACTVFSPKFNFDVGEKWESFTMPTESELETIPAENKPWWKTESLRAFLTDNPDARVIWVDDLIDANEEVEEANRKLAEDFDGQVAMIGVIPHLGVTPDSFAFIRRIATERWTSGVFIFE